jgi:hypothetical protein
MTRYCCWPSLPKTYFSLPDYEMKAAVEGDNPKKTLQETELLHYSAKQVGKNIWKITFGNKVSVEDVKAPNVGVAFHKSRWFMNQLNIYNDP